MAAVWDISEHLTHQPLVGAGRTAKNGKTPVVAGSPGWRCAGHAVEGMDAHGVRGPAGPPRRHGYEVSFASTTPGSPELVG